MRNKYGNRRTEVDGRVFASRREANRFLQLDLLQKAGTIQNLTLQPKFPLIVNGMKCGTYIADFQYEEGGKIIVEDSKGFRTREFILKKKLVRALHGIEVVEV